MLLHHLLLFIIINHNASYLFLHLVLQLCHLLRVFWVTGDVFLIEERLRQKNNNNEFTIVSLYATHYFHVPPCFLLQHYLLVSGYASIDCSIYDPIETHAEWVDVAMVLSVLILADERPQLLGLVLHHVDGILQRTHFHLTAGTQTDVQPGKRSKTTALVI